MAKDIAQSHHANFDTDLLHQYQDMVQKGMIEEDQAQIDLIIELENLKQDVLSIHAEQSSSWFAKFFKKRPMRSSIKGFYIWGEVGRGKSMLMDLFFNAINIPNKRRVHFHAFMQEVHEKIHEHRQAFKAGKTKIEDPIKPVAQYFINQASLLCFDEFVVRDIADAMILSRLFHQLFDQGLIMVATSNVAPEMLYKDGLNRALFVPFIELLSEQTHTYRLDSRTDFRLEKLSKKQRYLTPLNQKNQKQLDQLWQEIQNQPLEGKPAPKSITNKGRKIKIEEAHGKFVKFSFTDLCEQPLGASDYLALAKKFKTFIITDIPVMKKQDRNAAKRFITLIDTLYDRHIKIIISADAEPDKLYKAKSGDEAFEFTRTASRLHEMNSQEYLNQS